jgi:DNA-binding transcriptional LysR family regulator
MTTPQSNPYNVDFAELRTLRLVFENRSFSAAADILNVNQSAVSYTIDKLRRSFSDPLFIRQGGGIVATLRCSAIMESAVKLLDEFETIVLPAEFDPSIATHTFSIACNYYERQLILPLIVKKLDQLAPNVRLHIINSTSQGDLQLKRSEVEILIGPIRPDANDFYCRKLLSDRYVCIMDKSNPLARKPITMERYVSSKHAIVTYGGNWKSSYLVQLELGGLELNNVLSVPSPASLPATILGTNLIATVPKRIALSFGASVHIAKSPCPAPFDIDLIWTTRTHGSPVHAWLREIISREVAKHLPESDC